MTFDSQRLRLKDVANIVGGGTPSTSNAEYWGGNIPWLTPKDLSSNNEVYVAGGERYISKKGLQESSAKLLPTGSVLFSSRAPIGYIAIAKNEIATNQGFKSLKVNNEHNNIYFYYLLKHLTPYIQSIATGSTFKEISGNDLGNIEVDVPSLNIQKKISHCLLTLDKKISNLRAINQTLESIAQAIFKSWFVDFDPVHAKQQGVECVGIDKATADLFPASFVESELGLIPKGWEVGTVGKIFTLTMGQSPAGNTYNESGDGMEFYQGRTDFGFRFPSQRIFCNAPTRIAKENDILISVRAPVGDVNVALNECCIGRGVAAIRHPKDYQSYALYSMKQLSTKFKVFDGEGTVFGSINKTDFENIKLICPHEKIILTFEKIIEAFDKKIKNNEFSLRNIVALRDTLLPRLISGKLDLSNIEEQLGAVA
jgi:type I restriction enzyme S subunit